MTDHTAIERGVALVPEYKRALAERHQTGKIFFRIDFKEVETLVAALEAAGEMVGEMQMTCPTCHGEGYPAPDHGCCPTCGDSGKVPAAPAVIAAIGRT